MKNLFRTSLKLAIVSTLLLIGGVMTAQAQGAKLQMDQLDFLANRASETVDVKLDEHLMQTTAKFFSGKDPDDAEIREVLKGVKGIYVKRFEFEKEGEYSPADLESIRSQLRNTGWNRIVSVGSKKEISIEVYLMQNGDQVGGMAVLATGSRELTVVNIIGAIDLDKLSKLEGSFGVPPVGEAIREREKKK
jgi:hypothetical protein